MLASHDLQFFILSVRKIINDVQNIPSAEFHFTHTRPDKGKDT